MADYSFAQLESLWIQAGGPRAVAPLMAAIAMAESSGNSNAFNPSGASGLWQILGAVNPADQGSLFNPQVNAREAVAKYRTQGLRAWETYTNGDYRKFLPSGYVPPAAASTPAGTAAASSGGGGLLSWPGDVVRFFTDADQALGTASAVALALFRPSTYIRVAVGGLAVIFLVIGFYALAKAA